MARKFLYFVVFIIVLVAAALFALRLWSDQLTRLALVPTTQFEIQDPLANNAYQDPAMWFSRPGIGALNDPARWQPAEETPEETGNTAEENTASHSAISPQSESDETPVSDNDAATAEQPRFAVFFVHPTSYLDRSRWNAPLDDDRSQARARLFLRGMASAFNQASEIWAPRYRQATFGAFLTDSPAAEQAIDAAYRDIDQAFTFFLDSIADDTPIVLAGHSQGALHILRLLRDRITGTPLADQVAMAYPIGWPISLEHDLPELPLPACATPDQAGCIVSWTSFAEPADPGQALDIYREAAGFDGEIKGDSPILCVNPLTGTMNDAAPAEKNLGTLVPNAELTSGKLVPGAVSARCDERGLLLIGDPPNLGPYVLPGNNYHVYDIPLFWRNLQLDVVHRLQSRENSH